MVFIPSAIFSNLEKPLKDLITSDGSNIFDEYLNEGMEVENTLFFSKPTDQFRYLNQFHQYFLNNY